MSCIHAAKLAEAVCKLSTKISDLGAVRCVSRCTEHDLPNIHVRDRPFQHIVVYGEYF
jgi:hypothetical protein